MIIKDARHDVVTFVIELNLTLVSLFYFRPFKDIELEDEEEDEDIFIEKRRKQREELLKVGSLLCSMPILYMSIKV